MGKTRKGEKIGVEVIGCFEIGRLLVRSWKNRFRMHYYFAAGSDSALATLVLGVRRHRGACRLRNSCSRAWLSLISGRGDQASRFGPERLCYFKRRRNTVTPGIAANPLLAWTEVLDRLVRGQEGEEGEVDLLGATGSSH